LNGNELTIAPTTNKDNVEWSCTLSFTDGDTTKTATYSFTVDTKKPVIQLVIPQEHGQQER
jgi:hypothetical protein